MPAEKRVRAIEIDMKTLFPIIIAFLLITGCGRKGLLVPPESLLSAPVNDLTATQKGESFQVSWSMPEKDDGGRAARDLAFFRLFKREVLPPEEDCEACANAYQVLDDVDLEYLRNARRSGDRLFVSDAAVVAGKTYQYKVVSYMKDGAPSRDSNKSRLTKFVPLPAPRLKVISTPTSILLHWEGTALSEQGKALGYNIYRRRADGLPSFVPLNEALLSGTDYEDLRLDRGVTYTYSVRTAVESNGAVLESIPSNEEQGTLAEPD
jgi:predicted small lipoprotein YifL